MTSLSALVPILRARINNPNFTDSYLEHVIVGANYSIDKAVQILQSSPSIQQQHVQQPIKIESNQQEQPSISQSFQTAVMAGAQDIFNLSSGDISQLSKGV
ncbi:hypothetical protein FGO68_gene15439 [Halteria grandinella]|uniref:Uncharacterized protein n=1 Tax=Halteria grandinella TaxID=5974 RepID=A0A8J8ND72_HALGN|nr:hypothetical protein FGO68_gene15439 [Halteria grandinella]